MCGIVGYIGEGNAVPVILRGLRELEYRGYDSAGLSVLEAQGFTTFKAVGKLDQLVTKVGDYATQGSVTAMGHTRWATHGKPTEANAHPHTARYSQVVHNGIIENHQALRAGLAVSFASQTDSEVIVHVFEQHLAALGEQPDQLLAAFARTLDDLQGAYAILLICEHAPGCIFFARHGSPLQLGFSLNGCYFASSDAAMLGVCDRAYYLEDGYWGMATRDTVQLFDRDGKVLALEPRPLPPSRMAARKEGYRYFMEKEIYEQPRILADILAGRVHAEGVVFEECPAAWLEGMTSVTLCACGTSYHAALVGSYLLERLTGLPAKVEIASEFRYRHPVLDATGLFVVISQSGETADTLEALKRVKAQGIKTLALCNVDNSTIVREADHSIRLRAGIEKGVASTKAFSAQVMTLWLLALAWRGQHSTRAQPLDWPRESQALSAAAQAMQIPPGLHERLHRLSKRYLHGHGFFFIGRDLFYPLALEGALKLKEISYLHAEGYPAGEMKHGPIALADAHLFTIALMARTTLYDKIKSNVEELSARDVTLVAISAEDVALADDLIRIQAYDHPMLEFFAMLAVVQLLALEIAVRLGNDVDMPRNLAKSVTVE